MLLTMTLCLSPTPQEKVQEVEAKLLVELEQRQASTFDMEQQKKDIIQHE
jgi:hypothetical protein